MESHLQHHHHFFHDHYRQPLNHQKQMNSGLTRYQSAPSSCFSNLLDREFCEEILGRPSSPETQGILERFLVNSGDIIDNPSSQNLQEIKKDSPVRVVVPDVNQQVQIMASLNNNDTRLNQQQQQQQQSNYSSASQSFYRNQLKPPLPDKNSGPAGMNYKIVTSKGMEPLPQMKTGVGNNSNLVRHSSSPAGLFSNINIEIENGYPVMRTMGHTGADDRKASYSAASRPPTSSGRMSSIAEIGRKNMAEIKSDDTGFGEAHSSGYATGFPIGSWDDSAILPAGSKGLTDDDRTLSGLSTSETQNEDAVNRPPLLAHHLSLPKTSAEMATIEKFLQIQDAVPCKIRAKRGCATHPRSIAERVRRTRISERMRKLQDLVPNMEKQTNTADMLDLAVDYIKDLQRQVKMLLEHRAKCSCMNAQQQWQENARV